MMKKILIIFIVLILSGCTPKFKPHSLKFINEDGSITKNNETFYLRNDKFEDTIIIDLFIEPTSASHLRLLDELKSSLRLSLENELAILRIHPLMYLNDKYENNISAEVGTYLLALAEIDQTSFNQYFDLVYRESFILSNYENENLDLLERLDLSDKTQKTILKNKDIFTRKVIDATHKYIESNEDVFIKLTSKDKTEIIDFKTFKTAQKTFVNSLYKISGNQAKIKKLWPKLIEVSE